MSTNDRRFATPGFDADGASAAAASGAPDPSVIARLANEFFQALPGAGPSGGFPTPAVPGAALSADSLSLGVAQTGLPPSMTTVPGVVPTSPLASVPTRGFAPAGFTSPGRYPTEAAARGVHGLPGGNPGGLTELRLPAAGSVATVPTTASVPRTPPVPPVSAAVPPVPGATALSAGVPAVPGVQGFPTGSADAPFSFLQEARTLFGPLTGRPTATLPATADKLPFETEVRGLEALLPGVATPQFSPDVPGLGGGFGAADLAQPQLPGFAAAEVDPDLAFGFLADISGLEPLPGVAPTATPTGAATALPATPKAPEFHGGSSPGHFDVHAVRRDFPILQERVNGRPLIWLDNAATTQKPRQVIERLRHFYEHENSNIHRAAHTLAARSTDAYEGAREKVRRFLNAASAREIIFVRGCTEGINLIAKSWGAKNVRAGDEIVVTHLEHHANIVPWQMLCAETGAKLRVAPVDDSGQVILEEYERLLSHRTRLVSVSHVSNALGTITPVAEMVAAAHRHGAVAVVDGAQAVSHMPIDVQSIGCDFYVFSGHKVFAPTGIGAVYGRADALEHTPPWQGGGNMIADVTFERTVYQPPPFRFEAGTGNIADAVGMGAALDYVSRLGMQTIAAYEHELLVYATDALRRIPGLRLIGTAKEKAGVLSFTLDGFKTEEVGAALDREGIAVRSGHHCAQPILRRFGVESTVRPSLAFYNTFEEIDALANAVRNLKSGRHPGVA
jgi:cysteine desulfurase/selenocysteine lyase